MDQGSAPLSIRPPAGAADNLFHIEVSRNGGGTRINVFGELDIGTASALDLVLRDAEHSGGDAVVVDLAGLDFMDASALRRLLQAHERLGERLTLLRGPSQVQRVFELTDTEEQLPFA